MARSKQRQAKTETAPEGSKNRAEVALAVVGAIDGPTTLSELAAEVDRLVVEAGGESKPGASKYHTKKALQAAEAFGRVKLQKPTDVMVTPVK